MGKFLSKHESSNNLQLENLKKDETLYEDENLKDPRSPHPYNLSRTPVNEFSTPITPIHQGQTSLKRRFLQTIKLNPFDPRSPNNLINRTPITFSAEESENFGMDKILNLNDTFSDLFIETHLLNTQEDLISTISVSESVEHSNKSISDNNMELKDDQKLLDDTTENINININKNKKERIIEPLEKSVGRDPRSPSIEIDRTPIIFEEDDSSNNELETIESVLEIIKSNDEQPNDEKPKHKLIERVKNPPKKRIRSSSRLAAKKNMKSNNENFIYADKSKILSSTPKRTVEEVKRTPLGCVANKPHFPLKSKLVNQNSFIKSSSFNNSSASFTENQNEIHI